jgi:hypothetical protein
MPNQDMYLPCKIFTIIHPNYIIPAALTIKDTGAPICPNCNLNYNLGSCQGSGRRTEGIIIDFKKEGVLKIAHQQ